MKCSFIHIVAVVLALMACRHEPAPEELALQAAKVYYEQLVSGDCESFVEGTLLGDTIAPTYKEQLVLNMKMYLEQQQEHGGISAVEALRAKCDTITLKGIKNHEGQDSTIRVADAFLTLQYADSTREEIVVPMIEKGAIWYMR